MATATPSRTDARPRKPACPRLHRPQADNSRDSRPAMAGGDGGRSSARSSSSSYFAATGYLVFRDDLLAASFARQARQKQAYEDRIAALRVRHRPAVQPPAPQPGGIRGTARDVASRQATLDERQEILAGLGKAARSAGLGHTGQGRTERRRGATTRSPPAASTPADRDPTRSLGQPSRPPSTTLGGEQVAFLEDVASNAAERSERIAAVLKEIGRAPPKAKGTETPWAARSCRCRTMPIRRPSATASRLVMARSSSSRRSRRPRATCR